MSVQARDRFTNPKPFPNPDGKIFIFIIIVTQNVGNYTHPHACAPTQVQTTRGKKYEPGPGTSSNHGRARPSTLPVDSSP